MIIMFLKLCFCIGQEDYRRTVTEIDEKEYISLKIIVSELRNQYVSVEWNSERVVLK